MTTNADIPMAGEVTGAYASADEPLEISEPLLTSRFTPAAVKAIRAIVREELTAAAEALNFQPRRPRPLPEDFDEQVRRGQDGIRGLWS